MAGWQCADHSATAAILLGRLAGFDEARIQKSVQSGQWKQILEAAPTIRRN
jgi:hypothetical protein